MKSLILALCGAFCAAALAQAIELPFRKDGLWRIETVTDGERMLIKQCVDEASERETLERGRALNEKSCSKNETRREGDTYIVETDCTIGGSRTTSRSVISGDFATRVTMETVSRNLGEDGSESITELAIVSTRIGACEAGQAPGSIIFE